MKKQVSISGILMCVFLILTSCADTTSCTLVIKNANIKGDLKDYIEVVPGTYEVKKIPVERGLNYGAEDLFLPVNFKIIKNYDESKISVNTRIESIALQVMDGDAKTIDAYFTPSTSDDWDNINSILIGKPGSELTIMFKYTAYDKKKLANVLRKGKGIEIIDAEIKN